MRAVRRVCEGGIRGVFEEGLRGVRRVWAG